MTESAVYSARRKTFIVDCENVAIRLRINNCNRSESPSKLRHCRTCTYHRSRNRTRPIRTWKVDIENDFFYDAISIKRSRWDCETQSDAKETSVRYVRERLFKNDDSMELVLECLLYAGVSLRKESFLVHSFLALRLDFYHI